MPATNRLPTAAAVQHAVTPAPACLAAGRLQRMSPLTALQLLLSGVAALSDTRFELPVSIRDAGPHPTRPWGLAQVSACIDALWPSHPAAREARQQLECHQWVPTLRCIPALLRAAAQEPEAATPAAQALQAALRQQLPGVSMADVRRAALTLRAAWCLRGDTIPQQRAAQQLLLCDLQELLAGCPAHIGMGVAVWAYKAVSLSHPWCPVDKRRHGLMQQMLADAVRRGQDAKRAPPCRTVTGAVGRRNAGRALQRQTAAWADECAAAVADAESLSADTALHAGWLGAAVVANEDASHCVHLALALQHNAPAGSGRLPGPQRQEHARLLQQAEQLLRLSESMDTRLRPWLPKYVAAMLDVARSMNWRRVRGERVDSQTGACAGRRFGSRAACVAVPCRVAHCPGNSALFSCACSPEEVLDAVQQMRCSGCTLVAVHLRKCGGCHAVACEWRTQPASSVPAGLPLPLCSYPLQSLSSPLPRPCAPADCSKDCQTKHWREGGHRQECKRLAAAGSSAGGAGGSQS